MHDSTGKSLKQSTNDENDPASGLEKRARNPPAKGFQKIHDLLLQAE
jgi:hypothetical protein